MFVLLCGKESCLKCWKEWMLEWGAPALHRQQGYADVVSPACCWGQRVFTEHLPRSFQRTPLHRRLVLEIGKESVTAQICWGGASGLVENSPCWQGCLSTHCNLEATMVLFNRPSASRSRNQLLRHIPSLEINIINWGSLHWMFHTKPGMKYHHEHRTVQ